MTSTPPLWAPERTVTPDLASRLTADQFPELAPARVVALGAGWDNTVYLVNDQWVFRFPRRAVAVALLETEARVLPRVAPHLPLPIPVPTWTGRPTAEYPWPFTGYRYLPGDTASSAGLSPDQRGAAAPILGRFLRALHATDASALDLPGDTLDRLNMGKRRPVFLERLRQLHEGGILPREDRWIDRFDQHVASPPAAPIGQTLVHGDLYAGQILIDEGGSPTAVIDWGDVHIGHAAVDLAVVHSFLPAPAHAAFRQAYGPIDADTWRLAWLRALYHTVMLLAYASDVGRGELVREGLTALELLRDTAG